MYTYLGTYIVAIFKSLRKIIFYINLYLFQVRMLTMIFFPKFIIFINFTRHIAYFALSTYRIDLINSFIHRYICMIYLTWKICFNIDIIHY